MSADNYILVREHNGRYVVTNESASMDEPWPVREGYGQWFDTFTDAVEAAREMWSEYGLQVDCKQPVWENNGIQFPRLLAEIQATQDSLDMEALCESMDLSVEEVESLFERAQQAWERIKEEEL